MDDSEYRNRAEALLRSVEAQCDQLQETQDSLDWDVQRVGNMLTLVFENRSQIVINLQPPLQEVWMASLVAGLHFRCVDGVWLDTKSGLEFFASLSEQASAQSGCTIRFVP